MAKLIVIEGLDGSGKHTQATLSCDKLLEKGKDAVLVSFPIYDTPSGKAIKMYLNGEFGENPAGINPYLVSTDYTRNRYDSYVNGWKDDYENPNKIIIADRYVSSNMIYQGAKLTKGFQREEYFEWLCDLEYAKLGLPIEDLVIYIDTPIIISQSLLENRYHGKEKMDIHEKDVSYLKECRENALSLAEKEGWKIINSVSGDGTLKSMIDINKEIMDIIDLVQTFPADEITDGLVGMNRYMKDFFEDK